MKLTPAEKIFKVTDERREKYAKQIFKYEDVMAEIVKAASGGRGHIRIAQNLAASLKKTKAARQLLEHLKEAGYKPEWVAASDKERSNGKETGGFIQYEELRVRWTDIKIISGGQVEAG